MRSFTHDARGNQTGETRPGGSTVTVAYDGRARLASYSVGTASQTMLYNGADERIRVVTTPASGPTDTRQFVYDLDHRIVGEYGAGGASDLKAEYIWLLPEVGASGPTGGDDGTGGYMPLAVAVGVAGPTGITSEVQWVHSNHLGTPILTTNAAGQAVTPYGYAAIGFPGQFANALLLPGAEHYYNRYRDYDPTTGRYIQADPIGLAGGSNVYSYAGGNPITRVDPEGLLDFYFNRGNGWLSVYRRIRGPNGPKRLLMKVRATTGRTDCKCRDFVKDKGPIPLGAYYFTAESLSGSFGRNLLRRARGDWGSWRVPLEPDPSTQTYGRDGFFIHGGDMPGSAGCIDVGGGIFGNAVTNRLRELIESEPIHSLYVTGPYDPIRPIKWK